MDSRCTLTIDISVIRENYRDIKKLCNSSSVSVMVKANCYALGAKHIVPALVQEGCKHFFVASCDEALSLLSYVSNDVNIYVLNGVFAGTIDEFRSNNIIPVLNHIGQIELWYDLAKTTKRKMPCVLHINTGLHRLGIAYDEIDIIIERFGDIEKYLDTHYIMSHLISAGNSSSDTNEKQRLIFNQLVDKLSAIFSSKIKTSFANSGGILLGSQYHYDLVRPGAAIYGMSPRSDIVKNPVILEAPIIQIQNVKAGEFIGYDRIYRASKELIIGTLPVGYADGYTSLLSNYGKVYIDGYESSIIGRISMDLATIDMTDVPNMYHKIGQNVQLIGNDATPYKISMMSNVKGYEILTLLGGNRYKRVYLDNRSE